MPKCRKYKRPDVLHVGDRFAAESGSGLGCEDESLAATRAGTEANVALHFVRRVRVFGPRDPRQSNREGDGLVGHWNTRDELTETRELG
jgi:hypothetical protein